MSLPTDKQERKECPVTSGVLKYFPDAIAAVAHVSYVGNQQHNPGQPMHWARHKSTDHSDCVARHLIEHGTIDNDGLMHTAKLAWRSLALLQVEIETNRARERSILDHGTAFTVAETNFTPEQVLNFTIGDQRDWKNEVRDEAGTLEAIAPLTNDPHKMVEAETKTYTYFDPNTATITEEEGPIMIDIATIPHDPSLELRTRHRMEKVFGQFTNEHIEHDLYRSNRLLDPTQPDDRRDLIALELVKLGCPPEVAKQIVRGITFSNQVPEVCLNGNHGARWAYCAGPMRGYPKFNFPAFDEARDALLAKGYHVISPADIDRASNPEAEQVEKVDVTDQTKFILRDFWSLYFIRKQAMNCGPGISRSNAIALLNGWERSTGASAEFFLARWLGLSWLNNLGLPYAGSPVQDFAIRND